jgi:hypothetical protein
VFITPKWIFDRLILLREVSRLSYSMWYALAEFVDNSTQSRLNYESIIDQVLAKEGTVLKVEITYDREKRVITVADNSIGMTKADVVNALKIGKPTVDSKGRSKYGMGMKTAACWIGSNWSVTSCEWGSGEEWTATVNVADVASGKAKIPLTMKKVSRDAHYTKITIWNLNRSIQRRTEETIMTYLGAMYRVDMRNKKLILLFNGNSVPLPEGHDMARTEDGKEAREEFSTTIGGKPVKGWFAVLRTGSRKFGGFSLIQNDRQIKGYPDAWRPKSVFGGEDDEGGNSLVSQRLIGEIVLDGFDVSHTKDAILYSGSEEEELEKFLAEKTQRFKAFATSMRKGSKGTPWSKEKFKELVEGMKDEFNSPEIKDAATTTPLPPLSVIQDSIKKQAAAVTSEEEVLEVDVGDGLTVKLVLQDRTDNDPHLTLFPSSDKELMVIINQQHPYFVDIESEERVDELTRQYIYDGVAEFIIQKKSARREPDAIRKMKDQLLRARITRLHNRNAAIQESEIKKLHDVPPQPPAASTQ